ncbi:hypothetical protein BjapCC829_22020 [Bradyrhizobium barranii]|uniref:DUF1515 domain-containing protein n=1 Tax=Bradyrhizobium barranii TaxID=2992140 RepID=A0ABY3QYH6_9BRAD|nr:hypothetical protein [Bradyrhizobium japonicum]UFW91068.1 hypothetical protein BjapCC829_22020 [Bradyrhizobium japonicum]
MLLDLNQQMGDMRADIATMIAGLGHVGEKQKEQAEDVRKIEDRLLQGSNRHAEFAASLADIESKLEKFDPVAVAVTDLKPQVKELMDWKAKIAAIFVVASAIMGFATWFIWEGLKWLFPEAGKELFHRLFH